METILSRLSSARDRILLATDYPCASLERIIGMELAAMDICRALSEANRIGNRRAKSACMRILNFIRAALASTKEA